MAEQRFCEPLRGSSSLLPGPIHGDVGRVVDCAGLWSPLTVSSNLTHPPKVLRAYSSDGEHSVCTGEVEDSSPSRSTKICVDVLLDLFAELSQGRDIAPAQRTGIG